MIKNLKIQNEKARYTIAIVMLIFI